MKQGSHTCPTFIVLKFDQFSAHVYLQYLSFLLREEKEALGLKAALAHLAFQELR